MLMAYGSLALFAEIQVSDGREPGTEQVKDSSKVLLFHFSWYDQRGESIF